MTSRRLICYTPQFWPEMGAAPLQLVELAEGLVQHGIGVTVMAPQRDHRWPTRLMFRDLELCRVPTPQRGPWRHRRFRHQLQVYLEAELSKQTGHIEGLLGLGVAAEASVLAKAAHQFKVRAAIMLSRESKPLEVAQRSAPRSWRRALAAPLEILTTCPTTFFWLRRQSGFADRVRWLPAVVSPPQPINRAVDAAAARVALARLHQNFDVTPEQPVALSMLSMDGDPGAEELLIAWKRVLRVQPEARLWLIGSGPQARPIYRAIQDLELSRSVLMAGCFDDWTDLLAAATVYVHAERWVGDCFAIKKALSAGTCVVASDAWDRRQARCAGEAPTHLERDWFQLAPPIVGFQAGPPASLADAIIQRFAERDETIELGIRSRTWAHDIDLFGVALQCWLDWLHGAPVQSEGKSG